MITKGGRYFSEKYTLPILVGGIPSPVQTPPTVQLLLVTNGYVPVQIWEIYTLHILTLSLCLSTYHSTSLSLSLSLLFSLFLTEVDVKHGGISTLHKYLMRLLQALVQHQYRVGYHRLQSSHIASDHLKMEHCRGILRQIWFAGPCICPKLLRTSQPPPHLPAAPHPLALWIHAFSPRSPPLPVDPCLLCI